MHACMPCWCGVCVCVCVCVCLCFWTWRAGALDPLPAGVCLADGQSFSQPGAKQCVQLCVVRRRLVPTNQPPQHMGHTHQLHAAPPAGRAQTVVAMVVCAGLASCVCVCVLLTCCQQMTAPCTGLHSQLWGLATVVCAPARCCSP